MADPFLQLKLTWRKIGRLALWPLRCREGQIRIQEASLYEKKRGCTANKYVHVRQRKRTWRIKRTG